jgi:hypothetical protein
MEPDDVPDMVGMLLWINILNTATYMDKLFISKERKVSAVPGTGVQYIPGHVEPLVDLIVNDFLPFSGGILDLGGGGMRFAIPVALADKKITIVDLDRTGLDIDLIHEKMKGNNMEEVPDIFLLKKNIIIINEDIFNFLFYTTYTYALITAFRIIHFFSESEIKKFFNLVSSKIAPGGKIVISALTQYDEDNKKFNEVYVNSRPVSPENKYYREFTDSDAANRIQQEQNLSKRIHLVSCEYLEKLLEPTMLKIAYYDIPSTKIVKGYILEKRQ